MFPIHGESGRLLGLAAKTRGEVLDKSAAAGVPVRMRTKGAEIVGMRIGPGGGGLIWAADGRGYPAFADEGPAGALRKRRLWATLLGEVGSAVSRIGRRGGNIWVYRESGTATFPTVSDAA